ncbi:leucine-rich repeat-containing protein 72 [Polypterus senegalus]|uniref:leucine-rich repeat-containing protein 72 n=1 Tax=Polypterus senegalus TaxID=55291 RepID=UPI001965F6CE|nr:leucine-rich repeat-containing protein 72 [Polypterus senegalus]
MLNYLWLNNNKIRDVSGLKHNHGITELYLHNNQLTSVTGALNHLKSLQVLTLHNNQLTKLEETISELKGMQFLKTLSLFLNPLAQESPYRLYVIHHLPLLKMLDKKEIKQEEKEAAFRKYSPERFRILQSIAFGKRVESVVPNSQSRALIQHGDYATGRLQTCSLLRGRNGTLITRKMKRSLMQFSTVDWNTMATSKQTSEGETFETPHRVIIRFR